jgi:N-acetyl-anhydromuramyl-L-alanine amidase AmpD
VAYWGRPDATYGLRPTSEAAKPAGIVVHFTDETEVLRLVRYGHRADPGRGNAAYGYHFYIDQEGRIIQGAPMSKRTNHIKPLGHPARTKTAGHLDGGNSIALSLVGACKSPPLIPITYRCNEETISEQQHAAAVALVTALRKQYGVGCRSVYGHGELQTDRKSFEGLTLAQAMRAKC